MPRPPIFDESALLDRLTDGAIGSKRDVVFLIGAPISAPIAPNQPGVLDVEGIIKLVASTFANKAGVLAEFYDFIKRTPQYRYQDAFEFLLSRRGQDSANGIIQTAVLGANKRKTELINRLTEITVDDFRKLENQINDWHVPDAVSALGQIVTKFERPFGRRLLTSNFDPLVEIAIVAAGGNYYKTVLASDGSIDVTEAKGCHVVHFHGYWHGGDTLHTPRQLGQPRPKLKASLSRLLNNSTVVVLAYGGWDDIFTDALIDVLEDDSTSPDVLWTFYESKEEKIRERNKRILTKLDIGLNRGRVNLFRGIDCHSFLPKLHNSLEENSRQEARAKTESGELNLKPSLTLSQPTETVNKDHRKAIPNFAAMSDSPPRVDVWVGRASELNTITRSVSPITVITGIGGQGKSALAAVCLEQLVNSGNFDFWDWRDCHEEGDRFNTQISSIIERLTNGEIQSSEIESLDTTALVATFFHVVRDRKCLFVFDNVDHYVDFETLRPISGLKTLFDKALSRQHQCRFFFTCRPNLKADDPNILPIALLEGLSNQETLQLFTKTKSTGVELFSRGSHPAACRKRRRLRSDQRRHGGRTKRRRSLSNIESAISTITVQGTRYPESFQKLINR